MGADLSGPLFVWKYASHYRRHQVRGQGEVGVLCCGLTWGQFMPLAVGVLLIVA